MTEDEKIEVAVFRYGVISDFINGSQMTRAKKRQLLREKCARKWNLPYYSIAPGNAGCHRSPADCRDDKTQIDHAGR